MQVARNNEKQEFNQVRELRSSSGRFGDPRAAKGSDPTAADDCAVEQR